MSVLGAYGEDLKGGEDNGEGSQTPDDPKGSADDGKRLGLFESALDVAY